MAQRLCADCQAELPPTNRKAGRPYLRCPDCREKRNAARAREYSREKYHAKDVEQRRAENRTYYQTHREAHQQARKKYHVRKHAEQQEERRNVVRYCATCEEQLPAMSKRQYCERCARARNNASAERYKATHQEHMDAYYQSEHHKALHRRAARDYQRRRYARQREERLQRQSEHEREQMRVIAQLKAEIRECVGERLNAAAASQDLCVGDIAERVAESAERIMRRAWIKKKRGEIV